MSLPRATHASYVCGQPGRDVERIRECRESKRRVVNGVRVGSGILVFGKNLVLSLLGGILANFSAMGLAYLVTGHLTIGPWLKKLALFLILFGVTILCIALVFLFKDSSSAPEIEAGKILLFIGIITLPLGIVSAVIYKKRS